jgi:hypothetical protein
MANLFYEPFPCPVTVRQHWQTGLAVGLGVFALLYLFRPFGLHELQDHSTLLTTAAGYGLIALLVILFNRFVFPGTFPVIFNEKHWTVGKHLLFTAWIIFTVGIANFLYSHYMGFIRLDLQGFLYFQLVTLLVGIFPVSIAILVSYSYHLRRNLQSAATLEQALLSQPRSVPTGPDSLVGIPSENKGEQLQLPLNDLLYMTSADNYVEVVYREGKTVRKKLLRNTLSRMEALSAQYPVLYRCHRAYLVNLERVKATTGNSQGCKLILEDAEESVPVSRSQYRQLLRTLKG